MLRHALATHRRGFLLVGLASLGINLMMLTPTVYMLQVYDRVMVSQNSLTLLAVSLITIVLLVAMAFGEAWRTRLLVRISDAIDSRLGPPVFAACFEASLSAPSGQPARALGDLTQVRQFLTGHGVFAFFDAPWTPIYIAVLFLLHPALGLCALVFACIQGVLAAWSRRRSLPLTTTANVALAAEGSLIGSATGNPELIEAMGMGPNLHRRWAALRDTRQRTQEAQHAQGQRLAAISKFIRQAQQSLILGLGALLVIDGELTAGAMIAANVLMTRALAPIDLLVGNWRQAIGAREAFGRLRTLLDTFPARPALPVDAPPAGRLTLEGTRATAPGRDIPVLDNINLQLEPGTVTVVLGPSGSGKSTLARVLMGVWPQVEGSVLLDGQPLAGYDRCALGQHLGYLPQDIELLDGSVAENIARLAEPDSERVIAAARACGLHELILRLPRGYDTPVGASGGLLSGGMSQRIALARAVYGGPRILVLDEPNANLDEAGELALGRLVLERRAAGATVVVISHRPAILACADRVVVLEAGRIRLDGPRDATLAALQAPLPAPVAGAA